MLVKHRIALAACVIFLPVAIAWAAPADYVFVPSVEYGEREIDLKFGAASKVEGQSLSAGSVSFGYGIAPRWFTEIYAKFERTGGEGTRFDAWEWENKFQLFETGKYPIDLGFIVEIERPRNRSEGIEIRLGPLLQAEWDRVQLNLNLLLERHIHSDSAQRTEFGYQWQLKYRWRETFEYGLQGFGDTGPF